MTKTKTQRMKMKRLMINLNRRNLSKPSKRLAMMMMTILAKERTKNLNQVGLQENHSPSLLKRTTKRENTKNGDRFNANTINNVWGLDT
jgi:hypothetical protein